ncbi:hypothetical protein PPL_08132 [Heterostelium album PN500]|uniref:CCDC93 coiled-coil domain-containing protein n=1 Tax=Heterostelium pallidum (strain ATCC 26659 / Pp 5 / PN500) TaxID=670386 RepID=D3BIP9_HETP5|nr:hypothetical protein PPL_08132 [Heterostelium album PN500]EFA78673.1 hypothetical protein PPL_08132 [Heterostelium album PN500]|eukprot:XP_020430797.1 hypothetical protein PPL_08132 [Heterostelium album PN500]
MNFDDIKNKRKSIFFGDSESSSGDLSAFTKRGTITPGKIANAREGELSQMEDTESEQKFQEIIELLVTGGYFRARIQGLSPFDKVVGGMAWSITASNMDVDGDLFFQENSNIRQKIALSEELIKALNRMKCPFPLQAQQIQGLNYINLFPIIRWLIAKVIETREETGDLLRMYSQSMFNKDFKTPADVETATNLELSCNFVENVENRYKPTRKFKRAQLANPTPQQTLLEYGKLHRVSRQQASDKSAASQKLEAALGGKGAAANAEPDDHEEEEKRIHQMMKGMKGVEGDGSGKVSGSVLKNYLPSDEIQDLSDRHAEGSGESGGKMFGGEKLHRQKVSALEKQIQQKKEELKRLAAEHRELAERLEEMQNDANKRVAFNARIVLETEKLDALETPENTKMLKALRGLVLLNETLIAQEAKFKESCKRQMAEYKQKIAELVKGDDIDEEDTEQTQTTTQQEEQRHFAAAASHRRTAKSCGTLAVPASVCGVVGAVRCQVDRDTSTKYNVAMSSTSNKEMFIKSMDNIIDGIQQVLDKADSKRANERSKHSSLSDQYLQLVEQERNYYKFTKEFQEECRKNEILQAKLGELTAQ